MHAWSSLQKHVEHTPVIMVGAEMLVGKSYFGKTGLERVPIAASAPPANVTPPQGAQVVVLMEAVT
jgi:hypothetical protein